MSLELLEAIAQGIISPDEAHGRIYGWLLGTVTDLDTNLNRIKARIGKQGDNESTDWLVQIGSGSVEDLPEVGDKVGVIFHDGDPHRGAFFCFPQSASSNRPSQHAVLGENAWGLINYLIDQFNQLRADFNTFVGSFNTHTHASFGAPPTIISPPISPPPSGPALTTTALDANKGNAADGSTIANKSSSVPVLSKRMKLR